MTMMIRNWIILGVAAAVLLTYALTPGSSAAYDKQQATSQANACGNGDFGYSSYATYASYAAGDVFCSNTGSQVQGEENAAALTSQQN